MATRVYCDNCGNTVHQPVKYCFGPYQEGTTYTSYNQGLAQNAQWGAGVLGGVGNGGTAPIQQVTVQNKTCLSVIDLCPICEKVWMERVMKLTQSSD
jgi:hypothetical protein